MHKMNFTLNIDPPTTTAQQHRFGGYAQNGRAIIYDSPKLKEARKRLHDALIIFKPKEPFNDATRLTVTWHFTTKDKRKIGKWKLSRPDTDNLQKLFKDEMTRCGFWKDDALVVSEHVEKLWAEKGHIDVEVEEIRNFHTKEDLMNFWRVKNE